MSPFISLRPISYLYFEKCLKFWAGDRDFEFLLRCHGRRMFPGWHNVKWYAILPFHRPSHLFETPNRWRKLGEVSFNLHSDASSLCILLRLTFITSCLSVCGLEHCNVKVRGKHTFTFLGWACAGTIACVSSDNRVLSIRDGILVRHASFLRGHVDEYNVFGMLHDSSYDLNLGFPASCSSLLLDFSHCKLSWYP